MKSRISLAVLMCACFVILITTPVFAETEGRSTVTKMRVGSQLRQATTTDKTEVETGKDETRKTELNLRCAAVSTRINARIGFYNDRKTDHLEQYRNTKERVSKLVTQLDSRGYDTTKLKQDLTQLDSLMVKAGSDYSLFISKLEATKQSSCGEGSGFAALLKEAQVALETFRKDVLAIQDFVRTTLKTDLQAIKGQHAAVQNQTRTETNTK